MANIKLETLWQIEPHIVFKTFLSFIDKIIVLIEKLLSFLNGSETKV